MDSRVQHWDDMRLYELWLFPAESMHLMLFVAMNLMRRTHHHSLRVSLFLSFSVPLVQRRSPACNAMPEVLDFQALLQPAPEENPKKERKCDRGGRDARATALSFLTQSNACNSIGMVSTGTYLLSAVCLSVEFRKSPGRGGDHKAPCSDI